MRDTPRSGFPHFCAIPTRWMDNDVYGHVNNVHYYSYFDTAVNQLLIERGVLDIHKGEVVGFVVETACSYFSPVVFPDTVHAGVRVAKLGNSSVKYEIALYRNDDPLPSAAGHFVHVYVDRKSNGYVTVKCGNEPIEAFRSVSGDAMRLASSTQRQPR